MLTDRLEDTGNNHIIVVSGPAGCGKSSIAEYLSQSLGFAFLEGDSVRPPKIERQNTYLDGQPLTDSDRWDWLVLLREQSVRHIHQEKQSGIVVTCSALKSKYRDVFRVASYYDSSVKVRFLFLNAGPELLRNRVKSRRNHYMKDNMVLSQINSVEWPRAEEIDVTIIDASGSREKVQRLALDAVFRDNNEAVNSEKDGGIALCQL